MKILIKKSIELSLFLKEFRKNNFIYKLYENINLKNFNFNPRDNQKSIKISLFLKEIILFISYIKILNLKNFNFNP